MTMSTVQKALRAGADALKGHHCKGSHAQKDAEILLAKATGLRREDFIVDPNHKLSTNNLRCFQTLLRRRAKHEPLAYLTGTAWFRGREFFVSRHTLIPRWATEHMVIAALAAAPNTDIVFDVGTGSGCIAISLAAELPNAHVIAVDRSANALVMARKNARRHAMTDRIRFKYGDLLASTERSLASASQPLIVANLPYLPSSMIAKLSTDIRDYEPSSALDGGNDGLDLYRKMLDQLASIRPQGGFMLAAEMLSEQYVDLKKIIDNVFPSAKINRIKNYEGITIGLLART